MTKVRALLQRLQSSGVLLLLASAVLFLIGAVKFEGAGMHNAATLGVGAAIVAVAILAAFR